MNAHDKYKALLLMQDLAAYCVVGAARAVLQGQLSLEYLEKPVREYEAARDALEEYTASPEWQNYGKPAAQVTQ